MARPGGRATWTTASSRGDAAWRTSPDRALLVDTAWWSPVRMWREVRIGPGLVLHEEGNRGKGFRSTWRFLPEGGATRIVREMEVPSRLAGLGRPFATWLTRKDLEAHARECERDLRV